MTSKQEATTTTASDFSAEPMRRTNTAAATTTNNNRWHRAYVLASAAALLACVLMLQSALPTKGAIQSKRVYLVPVPVPVPIMVKQKVTAYAPPPRYPKRSPYGRRPYAYPSPYSPYASPYGPPPPPPPAPAPYAPHSPYGPHHYHHYPAASPYASHSALHYAAAIAAASAAAAAATPSPPPAPTTGEPCPDSEKTHNRPHPSESSHGDRNPFTGPLNAAASSPIAQALLAPSGSSSSSSGHTTGRDLLHAAASGSSSLAALSALAAAGGSQATSGQLAGALNKALLGLNQRHHLALGKLISGEAKMLSPTAFLGNQIEPVDTSSSSASVSPMPDMFDDSSRSETSSNSKSDPMNGSASNNGESVVAIGERPKNSELSRLMQIREKLDSVAQAVDKEQQNQQRQEQQHQHKHQEQQQQQQPQQHHQQQQLNTPGETQEQLSELLSTVSQSSRLNDREQLLEALRIIRERQSEEVLALAAHHLGLMAR